MSPSWLANIDPAHAWGNLAWPAFPASARRAGALAILPLYPFIATCRESGIDHIEQAASEFLREASACLGPLHPHLVLPPLRFLPRSHTDAFFTLEFREAHQLALSLAEGIAAAGFTKIVLFAPHESSVPFAATIAIDARAKLNVFTYVLTLPGRADWSLPSPLPQTTGEGEGKTLADLLSEISAHRLEAPVAAAAAAHPPGRAAAPTRAPAPPQALRARSLAGLGSEALREAARAPGATVIIPTGAIEQHGRHLPVGTDALLGQAQLAAAVEQLPASCPVWIAPPVTFGKSNEHKGWPGTLTIDAPTLHTLARSLALQLAELGFRRILFFNTHGGNTAVLRCLLAEAPLPGVELGLLQAGFRPELPAQEMAWGMHADNWETSLMLACAPELVQMEEAVCEYPAHLGDPGLLRPEKSPATYAWLTRDVSRSGVMGDPTAASEAQGREWLAAEGRSLAAALRC